MFAGKVRTLVASALWFAVGGCRGFGGWFEDGREKSPGTEGKEETLMLQFCNDSSRFVMTS